MTIMPWPRRSSREPLREDFAKLVSAKLEALHGAAQEGDANAQYRLGWIYAARLLAFRHYADPVESMKWLRRAAEQGHAGAQKILGRNYARANGVPPDYVEAYKWLSLAESARPWWLLRLESRRLAKKMTEGQVATGELLVRQWGPKPERPTRMR